MEIVREVYGITNELPKDEKYGLTSQIRRCAVSMPSNIAEGCGRGTDKEFNRYLDIALGSSYELETQLLLLDIFSEITFDEVEKLIENLNQLQRSIIALKKKL
ncbi:MAG: four helix bundle protein [Salibacteraceae bacterium]|jgi:four helix bundle protein